MVKLLKDDYFVAGVIDSKKKKFIRPKEVLADKTSANITAMQMLDKNPKLESVWIFKRSIKRVGIAKIA